MDNITTTGNVVLHLPMPAHAALDRTGGHEMRARAGNCGKEIGEGCKSPAGSKISVTNFSTNLWEIEKGEKEERSGQYLATSTAFLYLEA
jgi:hypothetical protein